MSGDDVALNGHIKEVYAQAGLALYLAQCFEMSLANFLFIFRRATNRSVTVEELLAVEESNGKKTLGSLLREAKSLCHFDSDALTRLEQALEFRNQLAHQFFKEHGESFLSHAGRESMLSSLAGIQRSLEIADTLIEAANRAMVKALGIPDHVVQEELAKIYARAADA